MAIELTIFALVVFGLLARMHSGDSADPEALTEGATSSTEGGATPTATDAPATPTADTTGRAGAAAGAHLPPDGPATLTGPAPIPPDDGSVGLRSTTTTSQDRATADWAPPESAAPPLRVERESGLPETRVRTVPRDEAVTLVARLCVAIEVRKTVDGWYPPSAGSGDDMHRGVEMLSAALPPSVRARFKTADTDRDGRPELIDPWGRPFVYWRADDYAAEQTVGPPAGRDGRAGAAHSAEGAPAAANRFQLISCGANGLYEGGDGDDVASWTR